MAAVDRFSAVLESRTSGPRHQTELLDRDRLPLSDGGTERWFEQLFSSRVQTAPTTSYVLRVNNAWPIYKLRLPYFGSPYDGCGVGLGIAAPNDELRINSSWTATATAANLTLRIPNTPCLRGAVFYAQAASTSRQNAIGIVTSTPYKLTIQ